jgi:hypothetical protein
MFNTIEMPIVQQLLVIPRLFYVEVVDMSEITPPSILTAISE